MSGRFAVLASMRLFPAASQLHASSGRSLPYSAAAVGSIRLDSPSVLQHIVLHGNSRVAFPPREPETCGGSCRKPQPAGPV
ncbi:hypothetical protein BD309DRAFT_944403 [Dichomitus squalens]|uniref:Uncharacterized protein n=1 Tax=Dichomitus squalens TaxID=114155 RepID=A0A4Q9N130_9APHY|nr:uncharacterized protein DICSQDRAFT_151829 [Dichomitus squalens LYAD-421 SS1]EJF65750.1 hypothetical protein DICSQDRAFT_151829 [Dichomitus squalens LYAD-421 SS1]TBU32376.1 hypothetical protein BD311DRAFT_654706 [Dichomitus squalens]TBU50653.1 hypothetical protein BD309DRAFT_944403 [Dichomitus squalens]TBU65959.1 hypothetical protein BD310DRAFT_34249 [Dichomitus squalens]